MLLISLIFTFGYLICIKEEVFTHQTNTEPYTFPLENHPYILNLLLDLISGYLLNFIHFAFLLKFLAFITSSK